MIRHLTLITLACSALNATGADAPQMAPAEPEGMQKIFKDLK